MISDMREQTYLVLAALASGRLHGYGIMSEAETVSGGRVTIRVGSLYAMLERLESEGLVATDGEEVVEGRFRRYYRLTDAGGAALRAEARSRVVVGKRVLARLSLQGGFA